MMANWVLPRTALRNKITLTDGLVDLNTLIETTGGFDFTGADCQTWMREARFSAPLSSLPMPMQDANPYPCYSEGSRTVSEALGNRRRHCRFDQRRSRSR
jgi:hypothetical protein